MITIALLGQPNSGKSTLFNALTGLNQHVGNWPGKTVERKEGSFTFHGTTYLIADLPGSYSLSANSQEEMVTRDYIISGQADLVCVLADASQLARSLFMLADYAGITVPVLLVLNMMDVARAQGKTLDAPLLERRLGVPVVPIVAASGDAAESFMQAAERALHEKRLINTSALLLAYKAIGPAYTALLPLLPTLGACGSMWLAAKVLEDDNAVIARLPASVHLPAPVPDGLMKTATCKYRWIGGLLAGAIGAPAAGRPALCALDRVATSRRWGVPIATCVILLGLMLSYIPALPFMGLAELIPELARPIASALGALGAPDFLIRLICEAGLNTLYLAVNMVGFVLGVTLVFGLIEETGFMARISFVFDSAMARLGLQGKSVMPLLVSFGCTVGGASGARVIDSWGQRVLTIALCWAIPCSATWSVVPLLAAAFFGWGAPLVILGIFAVAVLHMLLTARVFGPKLSPPHQRTGLVMELPPYHRPKWANLSRAVFLRVWHIFLRALRVIFCVSLAFWLLSCPIGEAGESIVGRIGAIIDPLTRVFGMGWRMFMAFLASALSKEAALGALSTLFAGENAITSLRSSVSAPEALAFIFAFTFNMPCVMAMTATCHETCSVKMTAKLAAYYLSMALVLSFVVYHVAALFM